MLRKIQRLLREAGGKQENEQRDSISRKGKKRLRRRRALGLAPAHSEEVGRRPGEEVRHLLYVRMGGKAGGGAWCTLRPC